MPKIQDQNGLLVSGRLNDVSLEAIGVYSFMRAAIAKGAGDPKREADIYRQHGKITLCMSVQSIGLALGKKDRVIWGALQELATGHGWVSKIEVTDPVWVLAEIKDGAIEWLAYKDKPVSQELLLIQPPATTGRMDCSKPNVANLPNCNDTIDIIKPEPIELTDDLLSSMPPDKIQARIRQHYESVFELKYNRRATFVKIGKEVKCCHFIFTVAGESVLQAERYLDFALDHWEEIQQVCPKLTGVPIPSTLCQAWVYNLISDAMANGFRKMADVQGMGDRAGSTNWKKESDGW